MGSGVIKCEYKRSIWCYIFFEPIDALTCSCIPRKAHPNYYKEW